MQHANNLKHKYLLLVILVSTIFLFFLSATLGEVWFKAFSKPANYLTYLALFYFLTCVVLAIFNEYLLCRNRNKVILFGATLGFFLSLLSIVVADSLVLPDMFERFLNSVKEFGMLGVLKAYSYRSFALLGWGIVPILLLVLRPLKSNKQQ